MGIDADERKALSEGVHKAAAGGPRGFVDDAGRPTRDARLWKVLANEMGLSALLVEEADGGAGAGVAEVAVVLEQLAGTLAVVPALSSLGSASALLRLVQGTSGAAVSTALAAGEITACVAWPQPASCDVAAVLTGVGCAEAGSTVGVTGSSGFVLDGYDADIVLAPVSIDGQDVIVSIDRAGQGVTCTPMTGLDLTRGLAEFEFATAAGTVLGSADLAAALNLTLVLIAAEQVGLAQHCHDVAVTWARERIQFDRPIGQFQAIKHQLVDLLMEVELARSALDVAVEAGDRYLADPNQATATALSIASGVAKAKCGEAAMTVADQSLHILGGIGFTWEHDAHLYLRRAKTLEVLFGTPAEHRTRFATSLLGAVRS